MIYGSQSLSIQSLDTVVLTANASVSTNVQKSSDFLTKIKTHPKEFVAEVQTLDPEALQTVTTLIEGLLQSSKDKEQELIDDLAVKLAQLNEANTNIVNAEESLNNANQAVAEAQAVADAAATHLDNMKEIHVEKTNEKDNSQTNHDNEIPSLNDEQQVLTEILNLLNSLPGGQDQPMSSEVSVPDDDRIFRDNNIILDRNFGFQIINTGHPIPVDGSISKWEYVAASNSGVTFQVWRLVSGTKYKLIGQNTVSSSAKGETIVVKIDPADQIKVKKGDLIGWRFHGQAAFGFMYGTPATVQYPMCDVYGCPTGQELDFPAGDGRLYQCRATVRET